MSERRTQDEMRDTCDKACEILKKTHDGDDLDPSDLKLTELAVNGYLNDAGREVFEKLYRRVVIDGNYVKPYLHDIEHITRDHEGYIYYKGIHIEHYDSDYVYSEDAKNSLLELKRHCEFLERKGVEVSIGSVIWGWENHADKYGAERLKELDALLCNYSLQYSQVEIYNCGREYKYYVCGLIEDLADIKDHPVTKSMIGRYSDDEYVITVGSFVYFNGKELAPPYAIKNISEVENLLASCHGYITKHGLLHELPAATYKTDFAEGYENALKLDKILNEAEGSLEYSEVFMYGSGNEHKKLYVCGIPTFDEIKKTHEYQYMREIYESSLSVTVTSYEYGKGEPLTPDEIPRVAEVVDLLYEGHDYFVKNDLSEELCWKDYTRDLEVDRRTSNAHHSESDYEAENGYEP